MIDVKTINVRTERRETLLDITREIAGIVSGSNIQNGVCRLFVPHTTARMTINENADRSVKHDVLKHMATMIPQLASFRHIEGNSDAHIKSTLVGVSLEIPISNESLMLATWQGIMFAEFDGPRTRRLHQGLAMILVNSNLAIFLHFPYRYHVGKV